MQERPQDRIFCAFLKHKLSTSLALLVMISFTFIIVVKSAFSCHFTMVFLLPGFHELWRSMMSTLLITEVKRQWAMLLLGLMTVLVWEVSDFFC